MSPGTWLGGAWIPERLRPSFLVMLHSVIQKLCFIFPLFHLQKRLRPNSRYMYSFCPLPFNQMNLYDQVAWTNWHLSKKTDDDDDEDDDDDCDGMKA